MAFCEIDALCWIPKAWLSAHDVSRLHDSLTVSVRKYGQQKPERVPTFSDRRDALGVPIHYGLDWLRMRGRIEETDWVISEGSPITVRKLPNPDHPSVNNPEDQRQFMESLLARMQQYHYGLGKAGTGTGKTVCALWTVGHLLRTTLVIVPTKAIAKQWRDEIKDHLGLEDDEIGSVQEGKCSWEGKKIVTAVVHNLTELKYPPEFYENFGFVIWDEAHKLGAEFFARSLKLFPSMYKLALTATPKRKDGGDKIFLNYFGQPSIVSRDKPIACNVCVVDFTPAKKYPPTIPRDVLLNYISKIPERNAVLVQWIVHMYRKGRQVLVIGDRVEQLLLLAALSKEAGVPEEIMGIFIGSYTNADGKKIKVKQTELDEVKRTAQIIFATYGMMEMAVNIPRLDAGIEATPRGSGEQVVGRIRRPLPGKKKPVWITIRDVGVPALIKMTAARLRDFRQCHCEVDEYGTHAPE